MAAITLARSGRRVVVHEVAARVGARFDGDHQGLENWTTEEDVLDFLNRKLDEGRQGYIVYPVIEESEKTDLRAATVMYEKLTGEGGPLSKRRVALLHGRLPGEERDATMRAFRDGDIDVLVATTVIEVGIDVPNATLMLIEHAERFGLSQLHQLRGRVSRGAVAGECYVLAGLTSEEAHERLLSFAKIRDGFALAEEDAKQRGLGEFFGTRQHGLGELHFGDLLRDRDLLELARKDAMEIVADDGRLTRPEHLLLRQAVIAKYGQSLDLATIG